MKLTKLEHSGLAIEKDGSVLLFDPVIFDKELPEFSNVVGIIITHKHEDHFQPAVIAHILTRNPNAKIYTTEDNLEDLSENLNAISSIVASQTDPSTDPKNVAISAAHPGETTKIGDFNLRFFGGDHAAIMPGKIPCQNLGVVVDGKIVNPGDSFDISGIETEGKVLLAPIAAPWCKISEVADFVTNAKPSVVIPIHDAVLSGLGLTYSAAHLSSVSRSINAEFHLLSPGESLEI